MSEIEKFTCCIYSMPKSSSVYNVRMAVFEHKYAPSMTSSQPLILSKGANPSDMPPCQFSMINKVKRANFVVYMSKNVSVSNPSDLDPKDHGWLLKTISIVSTGMMESNCHKVLITPSVRRVMGN